MIRMLLLFFPLLAYGTEMPEQQAIQQMITIMTPVHSDWLQESEKFAVAANSFCTTGKNLKTLREQWRTVQLDWSALNAYAIGPLTENGYLSNQVEYWPDKKNLVAFQIQEALRQEYPDKLDVAKLSVALRGLSASEFILFDETVKLEKKEQREHYCPLLLSIAQYQVKLSRQVQQEWQQYLPTMAVPNTKYQSHHEVLTDWLRVQVSTLEMQHKKLALPLGNPVQGKNTPQPYLAEFWRSGQSLESIRVALDLQQQLWQQGWRPLLAPRDLELANNIDALFIKIQQQQKALTRPLPKLLNSEAGMKSLQELYASLDALRKLYEVSVAKALAIQIGFNAHDGD